MNRYDTPADGDLYKAVIDLGLLALDGFKVRSLDAVASAYEKAERAREAGDPE
jgi:hypothetical protein